MMKSSTKIQLMNNKFTRQEDQQLRDLVLKEKLTNWVTISSKMPNRNVQQCRMRWKQISFRRGVGIEWTPEEDEIILKKYKDYGRHWKKIQQAVPNHTIAQIKTRITKLMNRYNGPTEPIYNIGNVNNQDSHPAINSSTEEEEKQLDSINDNNSDKPMPFNYWYTDDEQFEFFF